MKESRPYVGGQAVIEGVFMRAPRSVATAVRKSDGSIATTSEPYTPFFTKYKLFKLPLIRGAFVMVDSMVVGYKALSWSADEAEEDSSEKVLEEDSSEKAEKNPSESKKQPDQDSQESLGTTIKDQLIKIGTFAFSIGMGLLLFVAAPHLLTDGIGWATGAELDVEGYAFHIIDGIIKLFIFIGYIMLIRRQKDILRVFQYHGAEHKTIFAYESGLDLTVENVRFQSRFHPRCGTSFLLFVVAVSILVFAAVFPLLPDIPVENRLLKNLVMIAIKLPLALPVAALSYELIKLSSKFYHLAIFRALSTPGMLFQRLTTEEPDDSQLEVAIESLKKALEVEEGLGGKVLGLEGEVIDFSRTKAS